MAGRLRPRLTCDARHQYFWQAGIDGVLVNGKVVVPPLEAIFDSGTTLSYLPAADLAILVKALGAKTISVPDSTGERSIYYTL
jgi:hypothetical protein